MTKKILALVASLVGVLAFLLPVTTAPAANAETCLPVIGCVGGDIRHWNDDGYDKSIVLMCNFVDAFKKDANGNWVKRILWDKAKYLPEGQHSDSKCGNDTDVVIVREGEEIWCRQLTPQGTVGWNRAFDAAGPHKIVDNWSESCVVQVD